MRVKSPKLIPYNIALMALLLFVPLAQGVQVLPDAAKKDAVYRMYGDYKKDFPSVRDIAPKEARKRFDQGRVIFVDTRKPAEMAISVLPGAITQDEFTKHPERFFGKTVVAYCTISYRSGIFARDQAHRGIEVLNLKGGILAWILEGGQVNDAQGNPTRRVHVYGDKWDFAPSGWESVKFSFWEQMF